MAIRKNNIDDCMGATDGEIIDSLQEDVGILSHRIFDLERDLAEANDQYVLLTDELWAVLGSEDRRDYVVQVKELVAELAEARKAAEWVPVRERMPDNSKAVLVWCPERKNKYTACWKVPYWLHFGGACSSEVTEDVTHWKPLPNPPEKLSK